MDTAQLGLNPTQALGQASGIAWIFDLDAAQLRLNLTQASGLAWILCLDAGWPGLDPKRALGLA